VSRRAPRRKHGLEPEPAPGAAADRDRAAERGDPLADPEQPQVGRELAAHPAAVVLDASFLVVDGYRLLETVRLAVPGTPVLVVAEESVRNAGADGVKMVWLVDVRDETKPVPIAAFPIPQGDFCARGGRFGPHNIHENRPGSKNDDLLIYLCYFSAGIRIVDISNPFRPVETGFFVPPAPVGQPAIQINDVFVDAEGLIYITDRVGGGLYILEYTGPQPAQADDTARDLSGRDWGLSHPEFL